MVEELAVGRGRGVMELVDDDNVEMIRFEMIEVSGMQALDRREYVVEALGAGSSDPLLAKACVTQRVAESPHTLIQDLFAVGDEK